MSVLFTGSNGFVGTHASSLLRRQGLRVLGLGRSASPTDQVDHYLRHDLATPLTWEDGRREVETVVHCAALSAPWASPRAFERANVDGTRHVFGRDDAQLIALVQCADQPLHHIKIGGEVTGIA